MGKALSREHFLEGPLGDCFFALEALLTSPDLTLDCLEPATQDAIEVARATLDKVHKALDAYAGTREMALLAEPEPETRSNYHPDADPWEYGDR